MKIYRIFDLPVRLNIKWMNASTSGAIYRWIYQCEEHKCSIEYEKSIRIVPIHALYEDVCTFGLTMTMEMKMVTAMTTKKRLLHKNHFNSSHIAS